MTVILVPLLALATCAEQRGNPRLAALGVDQAATAIQPGGNMEGKEVRFGIANSALWATATTAASNGSVNSMHDSFTPLGGLVPMWLMQLGEVIFGGVGSGLYGMLIVRHRRRLRRRADGRAHAGVPGQEDRGLRDEDGVARHPASRRSWCSVGTAVAVVAAGGPRGGRQPRRRTASARSSTPSPRRATTTAAPSPGSAPTRPSTTLRSASAMLVAPLLAGDPGAGHRRLAGARRSTSRPAPARCRRTRRCSSCCWSASC